MKLSLVCLFTLVVLFLVRPQTATAQSPANASRPTSEQSLQELVKEVRQLRATLQRMNAALYKGQVILERLKLQQDQVSRMSRELNEVRESLNEARGHQTKFKELVSRAEAGVEADVKQPGALADLKAELEAINQREQRMAVRETQLANELELERARLNDLNDRLNALESEMAPNRP